MARTDPPPEVLDEMKKAFEQARAFHRLGLRHLDGAPARAVDGPEGEGRRSGRAGPPRVPDSPDTIRKARQFADPARGGYSAEELEGIFAACERAGFGLGKSHLLRLMTVPRKDRGQLQRRVLKGRWSVRRLDEEIARRYGRRRQGGRRRRMPLEEAGLLAQLGRMLESWRRWDAQLNREAGPGKPAPASALDGDVLEALSKANRALRELGAKVEKKRRG